MNVLVLLCLIVQIVVHSTKAAEVNLPPTLYVQSRVFCMEGGNVDINTARIGDHDASQFLQPKIAVNVSVLHGQLYLPVRSGLFFVHGNMVGTDSRFEIIGRLPDIQKAISVIKYLADVDFNGDDILTISATDMHLQTRPGAELGAKLELLADHAPVSVSTTITVEPVNDAPVIVASARFLTCDQQRVNDDGTPSLSTASFSATFSDADVRTPEQMLSTKFQLNLSTRYGTLRSAARGCDQSTYSCTVTGTLEELNQLAQKVTYTPDAQYNKYLGSERIVIVLEELNSPLREGESYKPATVTIPVIVRPTNHAPTVSTPIALSTSEDELLSLSGLMVDDVDVRDTVTVTVSVASGGLIQLSAHEVQPFKQSLKAYLVQRLLSDTHGKYYNSNFECMFDTFCLFHSPGSSQKCRVTDAVLRLHCRCARSSLYSVLPALGGLVRPGQSDDQSSG